VPPPITPPPSSIDCSYHRFTLGNGSHEGAHLPPPPTIPAPPLGPYKRRESRHPPPHLLLLSFSSSRAQAPPTLSATTTASSPLSPSHYTAALAPVRPETDSPRAPFSIAPSPVSHHAPERLLGRAMVRPCRRPLWSPRWNREPATPALVHEPWTESMPFPIRK
jgi:hypothetical protein